MSTPLEDTLDNYPVQKLAAAAEDKAGWYTPQEASGKLLESAVGGATGAALTGGASLLPMGMAGAASAAVPLAKAAGASDATADDIGLATALLPVAGVGAVAARNGLGSLARNAYADSIAQGLTPDQAGQHVLLADAVKQFGAANGLNPSQASQAYGDATNAALSAYRSNAVKVGTLDPDQAAIYLDAQRSAAAGNGGSAAKVLGLPDYHQDAVSNGIGQVNALASQAPSSGTVGPFASVGRAVASQVAPWVSGAGAVGAGLSGQFHLAADLGMAALAGKAPGVSAAAGFTGGIADRLLGSGMTPAQAQLLAARRVLAKSGVSVPTSDPLSDLQSAVSDVRGDLADQQTNATNDAADAAKAKQTATAYAQNTKTTNAAEATWQSALAQQAKQQAAGNPDPLSSALWADAQQQSSPNLAALTASQVKGFNADQSALAKRDTQEQAADAATQQRGQNLNEQAAAWLERDAIRQYKSNNPDAPVTGVGSLTASTPQQLFEATAGRYGSPADPTPPQMVQPPVASAGAPQRPVDGPPAASAPAPATGLPATATRPSTGSVTSPGGLPSGGLALAQMIHSDYFPNEGLPTHGELAGAINDLAADGVLHPLHADAALQGQNIGRNLAGAIADRVATSRGLPSILGPSPASFGNAQQTFEANVQNNAQQATAEVSQLLGQANGPSNGLPPIQNAYRWQSAVKTAQQHAEQMMALAPTMDEKVAISHIAATPGAADKAAIRDAFAAAHPGADMSRFTARLMRGT